MQGSTLAQGPPQGEKPAQDADATGPEKRPAEQDPAQEEKPADAPVQEAEQSEKQEESPAAAEPSPPPEQPGEKPGDEAEKGPAEPPPAESGPETGSPAPETVPEAVPTATPSPKVDRRAPRKPSRTPIVTTSTPSAGTEPLGPRGLVAAELGFAATSLNGGTGFWISPLLSGWFRVERTIAIAAEWGSVALLASPDPDSDRSSIGAGNPYLGFYSVRQHGPTVLRIGVGMTIPVAAISGENRDADWNTYQGAMAMRGMWRWWLWVPDSISIAIPVGWDSEVAGRWLWGGEAALASTVILPKPARSTVFLRGEPRTADLLIPLGLYAGYRTGDFAFGTHLHAVFVATGETELQLSMSPFGKLELGPGFLEARFTVNIDRPLGFAFEKGRFWGIHLGGGYGFH
jgi:hypothetical protein